MSWNENTYRVAPFNQSQAGKTLETPALKSLADGAAAKSGVCDMLSAKWVRMMIKGKVTSPSERMKHLNTAGTMRKAILRHTLEEQDCVQGLGTTITIPQNRGQLLDCLVRSKLSLKRLPGTGKKLRTPLHTVIDGYGLKLIGGNMQLFIAPAAEKTAKAVSEARGVCSIIAITTPRGAHAIAGRGGSFFVEFFDPNYGEYRIPTVAFKDWFTGLVIDHYKAANDKINVGQFEKEIMESDQRGIQWHVGTCNWMATIQAMNLLRSRGTDTLKTPGATQQLSRTDIESLVAMLGHEKRWSLDETMRLMQTLSQPERDWWMHAMHLRQSERPISED